MSNYAHILKANPKGINQYTRGGASAASAPKGPGPKDAISIEISRAGLTLANGKPLKTFVLGGKLYMGASQAVAASGVPMGFSVETASAALKTLASAGYEAKMTANGETYGEGKPMQIVEITGRKPAPAKAKKDEGGGGSDSKGNGSDGKATALMVRQWLAWHLPKRVA